MLTSSSAMNAATWLTASARHRPGHAAVSPAAGSVTVVPGRSVVMIEASQRCTRRASPSASIVDTW
jgi:hypothetical protein